MRTRLDDFALPTPCTTENDLSVTCNRCFSCFRSVYADIPGLIAAGYGDTPLRSLHFVCSGCGSDDTFAVVCGARHAGY
jgi:hypothetical protein